MRLSVDDSLEVKLAKKKRCKETTLTQAAIVGKSS